MHIWWDKKLNKRRVSYEEGEVERLVNELWVDGDHNEITQNPDGPNAKQMEYLLPYLPRYEGDIYRGSKERPAHHKIEIGEDFCFEHLSAWSRSQGMGEMHALKHDKDTPILYRVKNSTQGKDIKDISHKPSEEEILVSKNVHYTVVGISTIQSDGITMRLVDLQEKEKKDVR